MDVFSRREIAVDQLMQRVRAEVQGRSTEGEWAAPHLRTSEQRAGRIDPAHTIRLSLGQVTTCAGELQVKRVSNKTVHVMDILKHADREFVHVAYSAILHRPPDEGGMDTYLRLLRGGVSKLEIVRILLDSPEGRTVGARLVGVRRQLLVARICHWPIVGPIVRVVIALRNLTETESRGRALQGKLFTLLDGAASNLESYATATNSALRALEGAHNRITEYLNEAVNPEYAEVVQNTLQHAYDAITQLRTVVDGKSDKEDGRYCIEQIEHLSKCMRDHHSDRSALAIELAELRRQLDGKAEGEALEAVRAQWRGEFNLLEQSIEEKVSKTVLSQMLGEMRTAVQENIARVVEQAARSVESVAQTKADMVALEGIRELLAEKIAATHRVTAAIAERLERLTLEEFERARRHQDTMLEMLAHKADQSALAALQESKVDRITLQTVEEEIKAKLLDALNRMQQQVDALADGKAERSALQAMECSMVDTNALDIARTDALSAITAMELKLRGEIGVLSHAKADLAAVDSLRAEIETRMEEVQNRGVRAATDATMPLAAQIREIKRALVEQERRLSLLLEEARKRFPKPLSAGQIKRMVKEEDHVLDAMYSSFEDMFRGSREDIKERQRIYLPYVHAVRAGSGDAGVIDLGCGRGEWLEILREAKVHATGVDSNRVFIERCRELDLAVVESDALTFLRDLKPNSVGVITAFHLIEHLSHRTLVSCIDAAFRALRAGGLIIFETPNPRNLRVGSCEFYLDPTHQHPLPPDLMRYLLEARGFVCTEIRELHPCSESERVTDGTTMVNDILNRFFFSARDYGIIGKKA